MQIFLQLNSPLSPILTGATFNITANTGLVTPSSATGSQLLTGFPATVSSAAGIITLTPVGVQCNDPIDIWISEPTTTTTTTTADPRICFTYYVTASNAFSITVSPTLPGYAGKPTYTIPSFGFVYWSPSQSRWEFASLIDSGTVYSFLNIADPTPLSGSSTWTDANAIVGDPVMSTSITGQCPPTTTTTTTLAPTTTTSTTKIPTTSTTTSTTKVPTTTTTTSTSTSSTTTTTTVAPICCAPVATGISQNAGTGTITVTYTYNPSPSTCFACTAIKLEYSTNGGSTWLTANITSCGSQITTSNKPNGTLFRLKMSCGASPDSAPSNILTLVSATTTTTVAPIPCHYGVIGGTGCCQAVISSVYCSSVPNGTGLNNGSWSLVLGASANTPSNCACGTAYFVEYRVNGTGSWIALGSPINSDIQGRLIINSIYGSLVPASTNYIDIRIRTACNGSTWSTEYTYTPCRKWYNGTTSAISVSGGGLFIPPGQYYCYSGFMSNGLTVTSWCWQGTTTGVAGSCSNC